MRNANLVHGFLSFGLIGAAQFAITTTVHATTVTVHATNVQAATSFAECPAVGNDTTGCEFLITITGESKGVATAFTTTDSSPDLGPYDGSDDTLVGVLNKSGSAVTSLSLTSTVGLDIFGFDGDGACSATYAAAGCKGSTDPNGYAPRGVTFSGINAARTSGTVDFGPALANGASNWFSLENAVQANQIAPVPLPASAWLLLGGFGALVPFTRRRRTTL